MPRPCTIAPSGRPAPRGTDLALPDLRLARPREQDGLLGGAYVALQPGGGFDVIAADGTGEITQTQGSVDLLTLFAQFAGGQGGN